MANDRVELESKIAQLERTVDALSGELHEQQRALDALQAAVKVLAEQLKKRADGGDLEPHDTKPPHWG
ncbi:MAG: SlyX family protein [Planctomycetota bacterium]|nr:SlyX family protein [Planctomycetota bacterium]MEC8252346.1 SlyX family protein [Planctomycetota bacterium]MEC8652951.1 SlyX family protein [Planctomycetota bacterium]MEC9046556.1 SlyX family protein [Planctomycetota bacterium]